MFKMVPPKNSTCICQIVTLGNIEDFVLLLLPLMWGCRFLGIHCYANVLTIQSLIMLFLEGLAYFV